MDDTLSTWFDDPEFGDADDLFAILEGLQEAAPPTGHGGEAVAKKGELRRTFSPRGSKRRRVEEPEEEGSGGIRVSHITVERNRRKQMNEHLSVLRSLMPCFYVKRGDQASIIGGVVNYITELQQILQSLESKKQRKVFNEVLSPRLGVSSPRPLPLSPRKPPPSPRINLPISPRTPQPGSPYMSRIQPPPALPLAGYLSANNPLDLSSPCSSSTTSIDSSNELVANSKSAIAEVKVKFSGPNLVLKTISTRIPGQIVKIVSALEDLSLEILQLDISSIDDAMLYCFTIKIGIECQVSAEELALQVQQTFC